ncbi:PLP-dependent aminotransferase family protein [Rhodovibrio salinarum]|uniref:PLP-dependent aminotransferase family protein n=1 Tax=Rhodovibrio salinarum TaxID=1087 RepID=A0A934QHN8_9PROT|nr:PLP-dependent aminotransferase family protein [Rhodovibrio salinarum]MBK1697161.1 PLP-dependent aminotransferase family protein [Rhodovibrio salinarum]
MTEHLSWTPDLTARSGARYRAIADALAADIDAGRLPEGTRLPTHRALAQALEVTVGTVTRAYTEAERRGLVEATVGRGTFVRPHKATTADWMRPGSPPRNDPHSALSLEDCGAENVEPQGPIDLSVNYPARTFLAGALQPGLAGLDGDIGRLTALAGYQPSVGRPEHRAAGARWIAQFGLPAQADDIVPVHGTQGGLTAVLHALDRPGDALLVEELTWPGVHYIARQHGIRLITVASDAEGMRPDALAEAARRSGARTAYLVPTLHNPSNITMPDARRDALIETARAENLMLVEDDIYGFLAETPPAPLAARDPERAVYVTSLSKCVAPSLRIGFIKAPASLVPRIAQAVAADTLMVSALLLEIAMKLIDSGQAQAAARAQREEAAARQRIARRLLPLQEPAGADSSFHAWLQLPEGWRASSFTAEARAHGVAVTSGTAFRADGTDPGAVRLCLSAVPERAQLEQGLTIIADLLARRPEAAMPMV